MANPNYVMLQTEITWESRRTLYNWIVQVHSYLKLVPETLFITFNIIDRALSKASVPLASYQLVGLTALMIACKYEEIKPPSVYLVAEMAENVFKLEDFLKAERWLLNSLQFNLGVPTPMQFIRLIVKADNYDIKIRTLSKFFVEVMAIDERSLSRTWSLTAATAVYLAKKMCDDSSWVNYIHLLFFSDHLDRHIRMYHIRDMTSGH